MKIDKKNLVNIVKVISVFSILVCSGCALTAEELFMSKGPYGGKAYERPKQSIIFDYEKKVGPIPASRPSVTKPQPYRENLRERRKRDY